MAQTKPDRGTLHAKLVGRAVLVEISHVSDETTLRATIDSLAAGYWLPLSHSPQRSVWLNPNQVERLEWTVQ